MLVFSRVIVGNLNMLKRPLSVAVSCWFLILGSLVSLPSAYLGRNDPEMLAWMAHSPMPIPVAVQVAILFVSMGITLVAAVAMLQGHRGARTVYVVWSVIDTAVALATVPDRMVVLPGIFLFVVICAFLYTPKSNAWFSPRRAANDG